MRTPLAPHVRVFLEKQLCEREGVSPNTVESYTTTYVLLFEFVAKALGIRPSALAIQDFTAEMIGSFLTYLEMDRGNKRRTRNARLAAIKRLFGYVGRRVPAALELTGAIEAIPSKRYDQPIIRYLRREEVEAILAVPNLRTPSGVRDHAMLALAFAAGLRVSELVGLRLEDYDRRAREIRVYGKGRRKRTLPLWEETNAAIGRWMKLRPDSHEDALFLNRFGKPMTRHGFASRVKLYAAAAAKHLSTTVAGSVSPHTFRHSCAMNILEATGDIRKVSLWLGHANLETTEMYLHADPVEKLNTLAARVPPRLRRGVFRDGAERVRAPSGCRQQEEIAAHMVAGGRLATAAEGRLNRGCEQTVAVCM